MRVREFFLAISRMTALLLTVIAFSPVQSAQALDLSALKNLKNHIPVSKPSLSRHSGFPERAFAWTVRLGPNRSDTNLARRWAMASQRIKEEAAWLASCSNGACRDPRAAAWHSAVAVIKAAPKHTRPALTQHILTRAIRYVPDDLADDHWASPLHTLLRKAGDCEDHAILKRALLISAGFDEEDLRLLILRTPDGGGHVVLEVAGSQTPILDNRFRIPVTPAHLSRDQVAAVATGDGYRLVH